MKRLDAIPSAEARKRRGLLIEALEGGSIYLTVRATNAEFAAFREQINFRSSGACREVKVRKPTLSPETNHG